MKKLVSLLLIFAMAVSLAVPCWADDPTLAPQNPDAAANNTNAAAATGDTVKEIRIIAPPNRTTYTAGEVFEPAGMRLQLVHGDNTTVEISATQDDNVSFEPDPKKGQTLKEGQTSVTVIYTVNAANGTRVSTSQEITVTAAASSTPDPTPTPFYDTGAAPFISGYAATNAAGGEMISIKKGDVFNLVLRVVDNALAAYGGMDEDNVAAKLNSSQFTFTGLAEVSQFDSGTAEGKPYCTYVLLFRDVIYNGGGNTIQVDISYRDTARPVSSLSQVLSICEDEAARTPSLIVRDVNYGGASIAAGQPASLTLSVFATTGNEDLSDVMVSLSLPDGVTLSSGSQTTYLGAMKTGAMQSATFNLLPSATFTGGVANITVNLSGVGQESGQAVSGSSTVSIPVLQPERFEITNVECPDTLMLGEESYISVTFVNKGKTSIDNLSAEISGDNLANPGQSQFVGNIAAGTENSVDFDIAALNPGSITGLITLTYEDSTGAVKTLTTEYSVMVEEMPMFDEPYFDDPGMYDPGMMDEPGGGLPGWAIALLVLALAVGGFFGVRFVLKKRKAKALAALGDDDEDI